MIIEKEVKFQVDATFAKKVTANLKFKEEMNSFQRTVRRDTKDHELAKRGIFLRTRNDVKNVITLKRKTKENTEIFEREEYETEVGDIKTMEDILEILGFDEVQIMEKNRVQGTFKNVTIVFDELPFGMFMEIEGDEKDILEVSKELGLDFKKRIIKTYWDLWEDYKEVKGIKNQKNILFDKSKS